MFFLQCSQEAGRAEEEEEESNAGGDAEGGGDAGSRNDFICSIGDLDGIL